MKKVSSHTVAIVLFVTLFLTSCKKTENTAPASASTATASSHFVGNWNNSENSSVNGPATYPVTIQAPNSSTIAFIYLYGFHTQISATVINNNLTIPLQVIEGFNVSGSGTLANPNQINMTYVVSDNNTPNDNVTATLTK